MNASPAPVRTASAIDISKVGAFEATLFILCLITLVIDGLDLQLLSFAAPPIFSKETQCNYIRDVGQFATWLGRR
jgi:hypothetical protein